MEPERQAMGIADATPTRSTSTDDGSANAVHTTNCLRRAIRFRPSGRRTPRVQSAVSPQRINRKPAAANALACGSSRSQHCSPIQTHWWDGSGRRNRGFESRHPDNQIGQHMCRVGRRRAASRTAARGFDPSYRGPAIPSQWLPGMRRARPSSIICWKCSVMVCSTGR